MSSFRWYVTAATAVLGLGAGACATAEPPDGGGTDGRRIDARTTDGRPGDGPVTDAAAIDARPVDAREIDARPVDAPGCTTMTVQLLVNPNFDANPVGTGWMQTVIDPAYPPITSDDGIPEHTAPYKAWMGGFFSADDEVRQDVVVPVGTTQLVLRGVYEVRTDEFVAGVYDTSSVALTTTGNVVLETALAVDDDDATSSWTPFQRIFAQPYAGQTVRVRLRSHNDDTDVSGFFYDSLALDATVCQ